jgi:hypothetical protein
MGVRKSKKSRKTKKNDPNGSKRPRIGSFSSLGKVPKNRAKIGSGKKQKTSIANYRKKNEALGSKMNIAKTSQAAKRKKFVKKSNSSIDLDFKEEEILVQNS